MGKKTETSKKTNTSETAEKPAAKKVAAITQSVAVTAPKTAKKAPAAPKKTVTKATKPVFSLEALELRAYFIAEKRQLAGLPGDAHEDWIEAERQLLAELKAKKSKKA
jgi:hypothetical protein